MSTDQPVSSNDPIEEQSPEYPYKELDSPITEQVLNPDVPATVFKFDKEVHVKTLIDNIRYFWSSNQMIDIHLVGKDKQMYGFHMILLAGYSTKFRNTFAHNGMQWFSGILSVHDVTSQQIELLQHCLYKPDKFFQAMATAQPHNKEMLLDFATFFGLEELAINAFLHCGRVLSNWNEMMDQRCLTFSWLNTGESEVPCHGAIIASCSPVFRDQVLFDDSEPSLAMLYNKFQIEGQYQDKNIKKLIQFVYNAEIEIDKDSVIELLYLSCHLRMLSVAKASCIYIKNTLTPETCIGFLEVAHTAYALHNDSFCQLLFKYIEQYIVDNFSAVMITDNFKNKLDEKSIVQYMARSDLEEVSRSAVIQALLGWFLMDQNGRVEPMARLMALVEALMDHSGLRVVLKTAYDNNTQKLAYLEEVADKLPKVEVQEQQPTAGVQEE